MFNDFKKFISRGNVVDLAVGVIIGGAFGKIVSSLVNDIVMPILGLILGKINLTDLKIQITPESAINYGMFLQNVLDFIIIAFSIFLVVKLYTKLKDLEKKEEPAPVVAEPKLTLDQELLTEIRDLLENKK